MRKNKKINEEIKDRYIGNYVFNGDDPRAEWDGKDDTIETNYPNHDKTDYTNAVGRDYKKNE